MINLKELISWKQEHGLLPIKLIPQKPDQMDFIMLNGGRGNFCLHLGELIQDEQILHNRAWSGDTSIYVEVAGENVRIHNWKHSSPELLSTKDVRDHFDKFHRYIKKESSKTDFDIVPFIMDIFRRLRGETKELKNASEALNYLFVLLASIEEEKIDIDYNKWGIQNVSTPSFLEKYAAYLNEGVRNLKPELNIILRHTAGKLFQEAQKEIIYFGLQRDLWGLQSSDIKTKSILYSSIHYTPDYIARTIVENALSQTDLEKKESLKILDPACGSGEFFTEVLKQLWERGFSGQVELHGWDCSESAILTTRFLLEYEKRNIWGSHLSYQLKLVEDSLVESWNKDFDLILMNPPFMSWEQMEKPQRDIVASILKDKKKRRPNQASAFLEKAINSLAIDGIIGSIVPTSILTIESYEQLRNKWIEILELKLLGNFGNYVFRDAFTDISIIIGQKPERDFTQNPLLIWSKNKEGHTSECLLDLRKMQSSGIPKIEKRNYNIYKTTTFPLAKQSWKPLSISENELLRKVKLYRADNRLVDLGEIFNIHLGLIPGRTKIFIISEEEYYQIPEDEKELFRPITSKNSIKNGSINSYEYVWYPYNEIGPIINSETELKKIAPFFYEEVLKRNKDELLSRGRIDENNWWLLSEHRAWLRKNETRIISSEFGTSDSFALDLEGKFAIESGHAFVPKDTFETKDYFYFYLAVMSSSLFDTFLSIYSKQLAGGKWYVLAKRFTKNIPVPNIYNEQVRNIEAVNKLIFLGKNLKEDRLGVKMSIDELLRKYFYPQQSE